MYNFRASLAGGCIRELITSILHPEELAAPSSKRLFLDAGHILQDYVTSFLVKQGVNIPTARLSKELEGYQEHNGFSITGHVDGIYVEDAIPSIVEVKAVTDKWFNKVKNSKSWLTVYPQYYDQVQMYLSYHALDGEGVGTSFTGGPFGKARMVFYNRDTSEILQGFGIISNTTFRSDMIVPISPLHISQLLNKYETVVQHLDAGTSPDECEKEGYCFHCRVFNPPKNSSLPGVELEKDEYLFKWVDRYRKSRKDMLYNRNNILKRFNKYKTDKLIVDNQPLYRSNFC
jgi:hypothetical protein